MRRALLIAAALAISLFGAANASAATGDLRVGSPQDFDSPNPFQSIEAISVETEATLAYDQLIGVRTSDQGLDYKAGLASSAKVAPNGKTITFVLKKNIHWSDGKPFTSADVLWTFRAVLKNQTNVLHSTINSVTSVDAPTPYTFVLHLQSRDSEFLQKLAIPILPKHIWDKYPVAKLDKINGPSPTVTTAPYIISTWQKLGTTILTLNPKYDTWRNGGKQPAVKRILITYFTNPDSELREIKQGKIDYAYSGEPQWVEQTTGSPNLRVVSSPRGGYDEIAFNSCPTTGSPICSGPAKGVKIKVVQDPAIRKALAYAINRQQFAKTVFFGQATTAYGLISPRFKHYFIDISHGPLAYPYDPAKAKQILKAGGWNCSTTPCVKNGVKAEFTLDTLSTSQQFMQMAQRAKIDAKAVGIVINLVFMTDDALNNKIYASGSKKNLYAPNYDAFMWDWDVSGVTPTPILEVLRSFDSSSDSFYDSKAFDAALQGAKAATNPAQDVAETRKAQLIELGDLPYLPLVHTNAIEIARTDTWHGWQASPTPKGRLLWESPTQILDLQPGPAPVASTGAQAAVTSVAKSSGWLTTPRSVLIGSVLISLAILGSSFIASGRRRTEPLEWTEE